MNKKRIIVSVLSLIIFCSFTLSGCNKESKGDNYAVKGIEQFKKGDYENALSNLNLAVQNGYDNIKKDDLFYAIGSVKYKLDDISGCIEAYQTALDFNSENFDCWSGIGTAYYKLGENDKAKEAFENALKYDKFDEKSISLYISLGNMYISEDKPYSALEYLEPAVEMCDDSSTLYALLSLAYAQSLQYSKSETALNKATELGYPQIDSIKSKIEQIKKSNLTY